MIASIFWPCFWSMSHVIVKVLLLPVTAGLQGPFVSAVPVLVAWHQQGEAISTDRIRARFTVYSFGGFCSFGGGGWPYCVAFPLPVIAGLSAPDVEAGPVALDGALA